jgi:hypothetical protein
LYVPKSFDAAEVAIIESLTIIVGVYYNKPTI